MKFQGSWCVLALLICSSPSLAQSVDPAWAPADQEMRAKTLPPDIAGLAVATPITLISAQEGARDQMDSMLAWNRMGVGPEQNGFSRTLPEPIELRLDAVAAGRASATGAPYLGGFLATLPKGEVAWGTSISVRDAYRLRLHFSRVSLPPGGRMWVYGVSDKATEFGLELQGPTGEL